MLGWQDLNSALRSIPVKSAKEAGFLVRSEPGVSVSLKTSELLLCSPPPLCVLQPFLGMHEGITGFIFPTLHLLKFMSEPESLMKILLSPESLHFPRVWQRIFCLILLASDIVHIPIFTVQAPGCRLTSWLVLELHVFSLYATCTVKYCTFFCKLILTHTYLIHTYLSPQTTKIYI